MPGSAVCTGISIFIVSSTATTSPAATRSPSRATSRHTLPTISALAAYTRTSVAAALLEAQRRQGVDQAVTGLLGEDHVVDDARLGRHVRARDVLPVLGRQLVADRDRVLRVAQPAAVQQREPFGPMS